MPETIELRRLCDEEAEEGYALFTQTMRWLSAKSLPHPVPTLSLEKYWARQQRGENYGLFVNDRLAVVLSLVAATDTIYRDQIGTAPMMWLASLAVADGCHGRGLGQRAIEAAEAHVARAGADALYLDCYSAGILPGYYQSLGYAPVAMAQHAAQGGTHPIMALRKALCWEVRHCLTRTGKRK